MTVGTSTYKGLAVPLNGECELKQDTAATDFITLTGDASISGDYLVCRAGSTEKFWITSAGKAYAAGGAEVATKLVLPSGISLKFSAPYTTAISTGVSKGDVWLACDSSTPQLAVAVNAATTAAVIWYFVANTTAIGA